MSYDPIRVTRLRPVLGTFVAIEAQGDAQGATEAGVASAYAAIDRVERLMHPTRTGSDLRRLADAPPGVPVEVDRWTAEVLELSARLWRASAGVFDPVLPEGGDLGQLEQLGETTFATRGPLRIDLGGIAKGYAVDRAIAALEASGCEAGLVNAGGDLRCFGPPVAIRVRGASAGTPALEIRDGALAVSDGAAAPRPAEHRGYYRRGRAIVVRERAVICAATAAVADGLTKCALLMPPPEADAVIGQFGGWAIRG